MVGWLPYNNLDNQFCGSLIQHFQCVLVLNHATVSGTYFRNRSHVVLAIIQAMLNSQLYSISQLQPQRDFPQAFLELWASLSFTFLFIHNPQPPPPPPSKKKKNFITLPRRKQVASVVFYNTFDWLRKYALIIIFFLNFSGYIKLIRRRVVEIV